MIVIAVIVAREHREKGKRTTSKAVRRAGQARLEVGGHDVVDVDVDAGMQVIAKRTSAVAAPSPCSVRKSVSRPMM